MSEPKHTPGPWFVIAPQGKCAPDESGNLAIMAGDTLLAEVFHHRNQRGNDAGIYVDPAPDAALMASAPSLLADNERLREALRGMLDKADSLFTLATDSIVNTGDGWACKSCGMQLDTGGTHKADCCASAILDLNHVLHAAEAALSATERKGRQPSAQHCSSEIGDAE